MAEEINRFLDVDYCTKEHHYDHLFGTEQWRQITQQAIDPGERQRQQRKLYRDQLLTAAKYVRSFCMRNERNATDYYLFFCTNSIDGLEKMKQAMWRVDPTGSFTFSDASNPFQPLLLTEPNYADAQRLLTTQLKGKTMRLADVKEYVLAETPYLFMKKEVLRPMEVTSPPKIRVISADPRRRKGTFPDENMLITFL
ncbi:MAG: three-Cys-motif partner protein TcmP [Ktedonobacteraceae bacterium]|nr:three-Cys-motif partner protein TcmP [Ktedonobacteraceae bacterium]